MHRRKVAAASWTNQAQGEQKMIFASVNLAVVIRG